MIEIESIDTRGMQVVLDGLHNALIGTGGNGDASVITRDEARLLAAEIANDVWPKDRKKSADAIRRKVNKRFSALGEDAEFVQYGKNVQGESGSTSWYAATKNFLFGVRPDLDARKVDPDAALKVMLKTFEHITGSGNLKFDFRNPRSKQRILISQKILVRKSTINKVASKVIGWLGKLKASFAATAKQIAPNMTFPQWIEKHIEGGKTPKSITDLSGLSNAASPSVTFGSRAAGVGKQHALVQRAVRIRTKKMYQRLELILSGYSRDVSEGIRPRRHAKEPHG